MSLHNEIMALECSESWPGDYPLGFHNARHGAAQLAINADAEIARLQSQFDPSKFAHRPDCCGSQIDTHCLGCAMAEADTMRAEIARLTGENAVLRDLLRDCLPVLETVSDDDGEDWMIAMSLTAHIKAALDGQDGDLFSDGAIYAAASRRAAPEWHAEMDKLLGISDEMKK